MELLLMKKMFSFSVLWFFLRTSSWWFVVWLGLVWLLSLRSQRFCSRFSWNHKGTSHIFMFQTYLNSFGITRHGLKPVLPNASKLLYKHDSPYLKTKSVLHESVIFYLTAQNRIWADSSNTETACNHHGKWVLYDKACKLSCKAAGWQLTLWTCR